MVAKEAEVVNELDTDLDELTANEAVVANDELTEVLASEAEIA